MKIAIIGAGNIGLYVGARLIEAGGDVTFVGRPRMHEHLRKHGLKFSSYQGQAGFIPSDQVTYHLSLTELGKVDYIFLAVKTVQTDEVLKELCSVIHPKTRIINLQNGLGNRDLFELYGLGEQLIEGMVTFNVVINEDNQFLQSTSGPIIIDNSLDLWLLNLLNKARFEFRATNNIQGYKWSKLLLNLNNAVNALAGLPIKAELEEPLYRKILGELMKEALLVIKTKKIKLERLTPIDPEYVPYILNLPNGLFKLVAQRMINIDPKAKASMLMDLERNSQTEIDSINGKIVQLGTELHLNVPFNRKIVSLIKEAECKRLGSPQLSARVLWEKLS